ncbi:MAG TPA: phosphoribosylformylglycinamidine synthase subunit PurL [Thermoplasmatales archaeon]|nr:phosphoribosylformylglycinamidine synthase subunit PurL [Thermoplasmatales archaeon]
MNELFIKDGYIRRINLIDADDETLVEISRSMGLALSLEEMKKIRDYFMRRNRLPSDLELEAIAQSWSEHCCYKSSKHYLRMYVYSIAKDKIVAREDAGVLDFDENHYYVVALESHNHPSAIEPYGGAATGIGGILRDVLCMGAQPVALIDPLFFGKLDFRHEDLPSGVKHPRYLFSRVVEGIRDYGNRVGIPTIAGQVYFHNSYIGNCLVNVGCVGIVKKDKLAHSSVKRAGDILIYAGGKTGRDGIHGVTFASEELKEESEEKSITAVQLGDPITKEPLIHACLECNEKGLVEGMKDMGGGGLSCVCSETSYEGGFGAEIYLDKVPLRERDMEPWEIWVSESQERMLIVVKEENVEKVLNIFEGWDVEAVAIGKVIEEPLIRIYYKGQKIGELELLFQIGGVEYERKWNLPIKKEYEEPEFEIPDLNEILLKILSSYNVCSREWVVRQYDFEVRGSTIIKPMNGRIEKQTHSDASVIKPIDNSFRGLAVTSDVNPNLTSIDPYWGTCSAVDEACRNLSAVGARVNSFADCLNFGNPEKPDRMGEFVESLRALKDMASVLEVPFASGNVSFYNEGTKGSVAPTPTIMAVGIVNDVRKCITSSFKKEGNPIYLIGETKREMGGSEYYQALKINAGKVPRSNPHLLKSSIEKVVSAIEKGYIKACHDISNGGMAVSLAEMVIGGKGAEICLYPIKNLRTDFKLFSESNTRWIVEVDKTEEGNFKKIFDELSIYRIGEVKGKKLTIYDGDEMKKYIDLDRDELYEAWNKTLWEEMG